MAAGPSLFAKGVERLFLQQEEAEKSRVVANPRLQPLKLQNKSVVQTEATAAAPKITVALWLQCGRMKSQQTYSSLDGVCGIQAETI
jgi:hypothetical protein